MRIKIAICDDEKIALLTIGSAIQRTFEEYGIDSDLHEFTTLSSLRESLKTEKYDLLLLDIDVKSNEDGVAFAKRIQSENINTPIIYVSNCEDRVFETFETQAICFIRKRHFIDDLNRQIDFIVKKLKTDESSSIILISDTGRKNYIDLKDVSYVENSYKTQYFYMADGKSYIATKRTMKLLEQELLKFGFIRVHTSFLVNYSYISVLTQKEVFLKNKIKLPISRNRIVAVKSAYLELMKKTGSII